ncbi:hypothetical protein PC9H_005184 [Pleurotus ostreatus]|uniref:Uncharacterized protein n=1 Tax=Pleurotus ostreatus TaxID=5322 RepID=A0A8H6ZZF6_PLEOS|nr:uncharacterized protein PC9H_005184 [Pleurotus ostreatus]KAF7433234.1 hypothetical protein PC9H_005184 [Pleurotus ostreatus]
MSSIAFPMEPSGSASGSSRDDQLFASHFGTSSSFQMNPLSSHPPRSPHVSLISSASSRPQHTNFTGDIYSDGLDPVAVEAASSSVEDMDPEEERVKGAEDNVKVAEIWREMILTSNGRDKSFKLIQYSIRLYLFFHTGITTSRFLSSRVRPPWEAPLVTRLDKAASHFSFTRKLLLLFNWLSPLTAIMSQQTASLSDVNDSKKVAPKPFLQAALEAPPPVILELVNAVSDDVATLSRLGLLGRKLGERAGRFSDWCWFLSTLVGLVENSLERQVVVNLQREVESRLYDESMSGATAKSRPTVSKIDDKQLSRLRNKDYWLQISRAKLVMDLIFVSYELFKIRRGREPIKVFTGFAAAILSSAKLYNRHKTTLVKNMLAG